MRIRSKLLIILLCLVVPPLAATGYYALRQAKLLGDELAQHTATAFKLSAERELALMVDLIGEDLNDNRQMLELSLGLLAKAAGSALTAPHAGRPTPLYFDEAFATGTGLPSGLARLEGPDAPPLPATAEAMSLHLPPGLAPATALDEAQRLTSLLPQFRLTRHYLASNMIWTYVALHDGLMATYPGHGGLPAAYDPRTRQWYTAALSSSKPVWHIMIDAATKLLMATVSMPLHGPDGTVLGVIGLDAPLESMLPDSDLSKRWGDDVRALIVTTRQTDNGQEVVVLGSRAFQRAGHTWNAVLVPRPIDIADKEGMARLVTAVQRDDFSLVKITLSGQPCFAAYKPFSATRAGFLVVVPRQAVLRQADLVETRILNRTRGTMAVVAAFSLLAIASAVALAFLGARGVTRPVTELCGVVDKLAQGDLSARARVTGRDELAELAKAFNTMAPELAERLRLKQDMLLAMEVQQHLLPKAPPHLPGLDIAGTTVFCDETGGDYFDYLRFDSQSKDACDVMLGDVTGHGISAALFMATGRALMRGRAEAAAGPADLLTMVNGLLCQDTLDSGRFITLFFLRLARGGLAPRGELVWSRAGHDPALLYDPATDTFEELLGPGLPLGVTENFVYAQQTHAGLTPGQFLVIGTDGIWEARNAEGEMYGKDRFREVLRREADASADAIVSAVQEAVARFQAGAPRDDDITLVVVKALPTA